MSLSGHYDTYNELAIPTYDLGAPRLVWLLNAAAGVKQNDCLGRSDRSDCPQTFDILTST